MRGVGATAAAVATAAYVAVLAFLCLIICAMYRRDGKRLSPSFAWSRPRTLRMPTHVCRLRVVNTCMLLLPVPLPLPVPFVCQPRDRAKRAVDAGLFDDVDVVLMQEMFSRRDGKDTAKAMVKAAQRRLIDVQMAVAEVDIPPGFATDSGLAMAAVLPWTARYHSSRVLAGACRLCSAWG